MIKKIFLLTILVIVLVSLNWFKSVFAQDLSRLTDEQKNLIKQYRQETGSEADPYNYQSPDIFESDSAEGTPPQTTKEESIESNNPDVKLTPFEQLLPFGMNLFKKRNTGDLPVGIASASDYVLGPGDNVIIYLWGRVDKEFKLTVDREGKLFIPKVGEIVCWGLTLEQFTEKTKKRFSKVYSEFEITVSLGKIRSISIYITGEVASPGAYTVSSLTSLLDALYMAGGPNTRGSMRNIKLMRNGQAVAQVDLYKLLLEGDNTNDVKLLNSDVIFVPVAGPQVAIRGEIKRSAIYELLGNETAHDLLKLAGNPTPQAHLERVMLESISDKGEWQVIDLNLEDNSNDSMTLSNGDRLTVYSIFQAKQNVVAIFGQVKHGGYYERNDSLYFSSLIKQSQLQDYDVYFNRADLYRIYSDGKKELFEINLKNVLAGNPADDILLQNRDSIYIYSIDEIEIDKYVYIEGEVKHPGRYPLYENMTVEDLIFQAGSFTRGALKHKGEIARLDSLAEVTLINLNLENPDEKYSSLQEDDHLYIRQIPQWATDRAVSISGEVVYPGEYTLSGRKESLWHLIQRAGGFSKQAFPEGLIFKRASIKDNLNRLNITEIIDKSTPVKKDTLGNIVKEELELIFGKRFNNIQIEDITRRSFDNYCRKQVEYLFFGDLNKDTIERMVQVQGLENLDKALSRGKGVILLLSHFATTATRNLMTLICCNSIRSCATLRALAAAKSSPLLSL